MPEKKQKIGKQRKDKFYNLAKATGFRARSAFKLLQLNRKYNFLQKSRICVDLCAAPGGWLQVAQQHMPQSSVIIGVDLVAIKPIPNVITFQSDITTDDCRTRLKKEMADWKADCFLHDGAPNVGKSWIYDAYTQNTLVLSSFKLACEMLRKGGWFVTKVFRSTDYNNLMWVFQQLFEKVHAHKPSSSRDESAEIFVVCQDFKAPDKIDKNFFDIKAVFEGIDNDKERQTILKDFDKPKKKKAEGYEEDKSQGGVGMHVKKKVTDFLASANPLNFLANCSEIVFDQEYFRDHELTTPEVKELVKDLKVIGPGDAKTLKKWWNAMTKQMHKEIKELPDDPMEEDLDKKKEKDEPDTSDEEREMEEINEKLLALKKSEVSSIKRKKKLKMRALKKLKEAISDTAPSAALGVSTGDDPDLFNLKRIKKLVTKAKKGENPDDADDEFFSDSDLDMDSDNSFGEMDALSDDEDTIREKAREKKLRKRAQEKAEKQIAEGQSLLKSEESKKVRDARKANIWFTKPIFEGMDDMEDMTNMELDLAAKKFGLKDQEKGKKEDLEGEEPASANDDDEGMEEEEESSFDEADLSDTTDSENDDPAYHLRGPGWSFVDSQNKEEPIPTKENGGLTAEELAVATEMAMSKKKKREYLENSYNRWRFDDDTGALPDWFLDDEKIHQRPDSGPSVQGSKNKELVDFYKERAKAANVRTIKKVAEAKARKKKKLVARRDKARKTAEGILAQADVSEREKSVMVKQVYSKAGLSVSGGKLKEQKAKPSIIVAKRGVGKRVARPKGVKGNFKVVDPRMKNDLLKKKRREKREKQRGSSAKGRADFKKKMNNNKMGANAKRSFSGGKSRQNKAKFSKNSKN